jgi:hypothetical protein
MLGDDRADIANPQSLAHRTNVHYLTAEYEKERDGMMRAPSVSWRIQDNRPHEELGELSREVQLYQECFRLPVTDLPWSADADAVVARRERLLNSPEAIARRAESTRRMLESRRQDLLRDAEQLAAWRAGALLPTFDYTLEDDSACFRIKGDNVETSRGATVPVADVRRVMRVYQLAVKANALPWERGDYARQDEETRLGHFRLDHIDASGNVRAGCHYFNAAEVAHLATLLGV